jgi:hypothetical protein
MIRICSKGVFKKIKKVLKLLGIATIIALFYIQFIHGNWDWNDNGYLFEN